MTTKIDAEFAAIQIRAAIARGGNWPQCGDIDIAKYQAGETASFPFRLQRGDVFHVTVVKVKDAPISAIDPVGEFHRGKGCCDGTDPSGCHRRKLEREEAERQEAARAKAIQAKPGPHEYDGTEPSYFGEHSPCPPAVHRKLRMGDKCGLCGHVA
jgi:hypothetical protein